MNACAAIRVYSTVEFESGIQGADPHGLVLMLYQGALKAIEHTRLHIQQNNIEAKNRSIQHAITIIKQGLQAGLDQQAGGKLAQNLDDLYDYMVRRLIMANLTCDITTLNEVHQLLSELKSGWEGIAQQVKSRC